MAIATAEFDLIRNLVLKRAGIVLDVGKEYLVETRLLSLARQEGLATLEELLGRLRSQAIPGLDQKVVEAMTTNETSFFRDGHPFEALRKQIVPALLTSLAPQRTLNIWCAASSSGQEPYSIAMLLREHFPELLNWKVTFIASDLSRDMVARSRNGLYTQLEVNRGLPAPLLVKYFRKQGIDWQIDESLRRMIDFREINLTETWAAMPPLDLVFIRNVMIYFDVEMKRQILQKVRRLLRPHGYLFLGGAETTINLDDTFERVQIDRSGCYRLRSA